MYGSVKQASIHLIAHSDRPVCQTLDSGQDDRLTAPRWRYDRDMAKTRLSNTMPAERVL